jgi:maleate cis-trans isomerase
MAVEYAWRGLVGLLTPQANTTVEPEFAILLPPGVATVNARMVSGASTLNYRLRDYFSTLDATVSQFSNAPVGVVAIACTGASYIVTRPVERKLVDDLSRRRGVPVVTSGQAVLDALAALGARRIALVSPYPPDLTAASVRYWEAGGLEIARVVEAAPESGAFHSIYAISAGSARAALDRLDGVPGVEAVVMLGTGMPTLRPILEKPRAAGAPVLSCTLATAWRAVLALEGKAPDRAGLLAWIDNPEWASRLQAQSKGQAAA